MINVQFHISTRLLLVYFLIWKQGPILNPYLVIFIYLFIYLFIYSLFKVDLYLAYRLRNTVKLTYWTLLQNLSLKSLFSRPEGCVTAAIMKGGKTTTHIQHQRQSTVTSWQWQPNSFEEKIFATQSQPYELSLKQKWNFGIHADCSG